MAKLKLVLSNLEPGLVELTSRSDHKTVATWALDCAERVLLHFEKQHPDDPRPRLAIEEGRRWVESGLFKMSVIRGASLGSHAAARDVGQDNAARFAARAAGQAVATAHVATHCIGAALYALKAVQEATGSDEAAITAEREWQLSHLLELSASGSLGQ
jgi:hypothetical protein